MVKYDYTYALAANQGSSSKATAQYIVVHETGNANNTGPNSAKNEAIYMKNHWQSAYTHAIAGWDKVYIIGEPGYVAYGAGSTANARSPFQIELARYSDHNLAIKAYHNYVNAIREYAKKYSIPLTLDGAGNGIKSHKWVSDNLWGNHQDPYAYLQSIGISKSKLASNIAHGIGSTVAKNPATPGAAKPATANQPTYALRSLNASWLPNVTGKNDVNSNGYAGVPFQKHDYLTVSVPGGCQYQVHVVGGGWLPMVTQSHKGDLVNGAAGIGGKAIDGIRIKGNKHAVKYRVQTTKRSGWLATVTNLSDYAGWYGEPIDRDRKSVV